MLLRVNYWVKRHKLNTMILPNVLKQGMFSALIFLTYYYLFHLIYGILYFVIRLSGMSVKDLWYRSVCTTRIGSFKIVTLLPIKGILVFELCDLPALHAIFHDVFHDNVYLKFMRFKLKRATRLIADVGSHIGVTVITFAKLFPKVRIVAVEPLERNIRLLVRNIYLNKLSNRVKIIRCSLSNVVRAGFIYVHSGGFDEATILPEGHLAYKNLSYKLTKIPIKMLTLDMLIEALRISSIDLLKIDAEGAEYLILEGATNALRKGIIKRMAIAAYHTGNWKAIVLYLKKMKYRVIVRNGYIYAWRDKG